MFVTSFAAGVFLRRFITAVKHVKRYSLRRHLISSEAHWSGSGGLFDPAHKVVCGKEEQVVREITQAASSKFCIAFGLMGLAAEAVHNWRSYI